MIRSFLKNKQRAYPVFLLFEGGSALFYTLVFTVNMVYQAQTVGLSPFQLVLVGTVLEVTVFVFEVPTGVVADAYSRRLSVIIGVFLTGAGFLLEGAIPQFGAVLFTQVLWGLGATFISGAASAWIADEVGEERAGDAFVRGAQIGQIGSLIGIPISAGLGSIAIQLPILLGGACFVLLGVLLVAIMPETAFAPTPRGERATWAALLSTFRDGLRLVRGRAMLVIILGVTAFFGLSSEGFDRLYTPHLLDNFTFPGGDRIEPVIWFGIIAAAGSLISLAATELVRRRVKTTDPARVIRVMLLINVGMVAAMLVFAWAGSFALALTAYLLARTGRRVSGPLLSAWINPQVTSNVRATVFSLAAQVDAIGQIAGGPGVGYIGSHVSLRAALSTSAVILSPVIVLFAAALRRTRQVVLASAEN